jgi:hypothetical protein
LPEGAAWLERSLEVVAAHPEEFGKSRMETLELQLAVERARYHRRATEGLPVFEKYATGKVPETSAGIMFYSNYALVSFLARRYDIMGSVLAMLEHFSKAGSGSTVYLMFSIAAAKLAIVERRFDDAETFIKAGREEMKAQGFFLAYELQYRGLETILAYKRGDVKTTEADVRRNTKWLHSRRFSLSRSVWVHFYAIVGGLVAFRMTGVPLRKYLQKSFHNDLNDELAEYCVLLEPDVAEASGQ